MQYSTNPQPKRAPLGLVVRSFKSKTAQVSHKVAVDNFTLPISLRMIGCTSFENSALCSKYFLSEMAKKNLVPI